LERESRKKNLSPSSITNKTPSKEEENNEKLRQLLKAWRNQLKEAEKQHEERPLIIEWEYVSSKTKRNSRTKREDIECVPRENGKIFPSHFTTISKWVLESRTRSEIAKEEEKRATVYEMERIREGNQ